MQPYHAVGGEPNVWPVGVPVVDASHEAVDVRSATDRSLAEAELESHVDVDRGDIQPRTAGASGRKDHDALAAGHREGGGGPDMTVLAPLVRRAPSRRDASLERVLREKLLGLRMDR